MSRLLSGQAATRDAASPHRSPARAVAPEAEPVPPPVAPGPVAPQVAWRPPREHLSAGRWGWPGLAAADRCGPRPGRRYRGRSPWPGPSGRSARAIPSRTRQVFDIEGTVRAPRRKGSGSRPFARHATAGSTSRWLSTSAPRWDSGGRSPRNCTGCSAAPGLSGPSASGGSIPTPSRLGSGPG